MNNLLYRALGLIVGLAISASPINTWAGATDAGSIQRTLPKPEIKLPETKGKRAVDETPEDTSDPAVSFTTIAFKGNTLVSDDSLTSAVSSFIGRPLRMRDLGNLRKVISEYYRNQGFWATALIEKQDITTQRLIVTIFEGKVGAIKIQSKDSPLRFPESRAKNFITNTQIPGEPLRITDLDNSIADLDAIPGITASVRLGRGQSLGETDIIVTAENTPYLNGSAKVDNQGSRSTGYNRATLTTNIDSPFGLGEQFNLTYLKAKGLDYFGIAGNYPILDDGTKLTLSYTNMHYELFYPLKTLSASGNSNSYAANVSRPLYRKKDGLQVHGSVEYGYRDFYNETGAEIVSSDKVIQSITAAVSVQSQGLFFGNGILIGDLSYAHGVLDQGSLEADQNAAATQGSYNKVNANFIRVQQLTNKDTLWLTLSSQFALKGNLDSAEKMSLGGSTGVRAYPAAEANGDHGIILKAELRHAFLANLQGAVFYDWGQIYQNNKTWSTWQADSGSTAPNIYQLKGAGVGMLWQPYQGYEMTMDVATKIGNNKREDANGNDTDGTEWGTRFWVGLTKVF